MKIAHIIPTYFPAVRYGGPIRAVHDLCKYLVARGHEVDVFTTNVDGEGTIGAGAFHEDCIDGVTVRYYPVQAPRKLYYSPELASALKERIAEFDVLHLHSVFLYPTLKAARFALEQGTPYLIAPRGMLVKELISKKSRLLKSAWITLFERRTIEQAAAVHVTTALETREIRRFDFSLPPVVEIPNGVDVPTIASPTARELNTVLFLGRIDWKKGIERLITALSALDDTRLIIAGNDEIGYTSKLTKLCERLGVRDRVDFLGQVEGEEKWRLYRRATVFVLPSYSENFANTVLESMAAECPVVVTPEVGLAEVVERNAVGIVTSGEPEHLVSAIRSMLDDPQSTLAMGRKGRRLVEEQYSWPDIAKTMEDAYCSVVDSAQRRVVA